MAIKGGRFDEAERRFTQLAEATDSPEAWAMLAVSKLGRLITGDTTVEEVRYCFDEARSRCNEASDIEQIELVAGTKTTELIRALYGHLATLRRAGDAASDAAMTAAMAGIASVVVGTNSHSRFGAFASLNVFDRSLDGVTGAATDVSDLKEAAGSCHRLIRALTEFVRTFSVNPSEEYLEVIAALDDIEQSLLVRTKKQIAEIEGKAYEAPTAPAKLKVSDITDWRSLDDHDSGRQMFDLAGEWHLQLGNERLVASSLSEIYRWTVERRVQPTSLVWHSSLSEWQTASSIEPLRDALSLTPSRGRVLQRCGHCREIIVIDLKEARFFLGTATTTCAWCKRKLNVRRADLRPEQRLWRVKEAEAVAVTSVSEVKA